MVVGGERVRRRRRRRRGRCIFEGLGFGGWVGWFFGEREG